ncbi:MAG: aminodeoxychorismate synthase component I [Actinomycetota bacterium]|nr:aminodeoxychorismate synthase component I [Actinomycetota bacterium]
MVIVDDPPGRSVRSLRVVDRAREGVPSARFDDLTDAHGSFRLDGYLGEITATRPSEVAGALAAAEAAVRPGHWAAGFVSYEAAPGFDPTLAVRPPAPADHRPPLVWFALFERRVWVDPPTPCPDRADTAHARWSLEVDAESYRDRVRRIRSHIGAGDTYQLNLTHRWRSPLAPDPAQIYPRLLTAQRPGYGALIDTGRWVVASASPELFFHWRNHVVTCRPMKGTAPRGRWAEEDREAGAALAASAKDRAENVMIVDLVRNDLGRVAEYGTVAVTDLCRLERYPTLWQLTSGVNARPRGGTTLVDLFRALFPSGSVTGAPKRRTMELITEIERDRRGVYCGAVGFLGPDEARFNVAIRTVVVDKVTGQAEYGSGGGIVWDSDPDQEYAETKAKAGILFAPTRPFDLIETLAFVPGEGLRDRDRHLDRLAGSAEYFGYPLCRQSVSDLLDHAIESCGAPALVRLSLPVSGRAWIETGPLPLAVEGRHVRLVVDDQPVDSSDVWLFHKTSLRTRYTDRRARHPEADDVVLVNEQGQVTETTIANLAVCLGGRWCTPPLSAGCLPGVERSRLLDEGHVIERSITVAELGGADEVALISSVRGWRPATVMPGKS